MTKRIVRTLSRTDRRGALRRPFTAAIVADLHSAPFDDILEPMRGVDAILIVGDLVNRHMDNHSEASRFLQAAPEIAPTWFALGNHENKYQNRETFLREAEGSRVRLLDNAWVRLRDDLVLGGLSSGSPGKGPASTAVVGEMAQETGFRLLMCHHPEYYESGVAGRGIDLTVSGHAHGGQMVFFGRGLFAPGQGFFPRLTSGWYDDGHLLVSRGLTNGTGLPRVNNPCELILLTLQPKEEA